MLEYKLASLRSLNNQNRELIIKLATFDDSHNDKARKSTIYPMIGIGAGLGVGAGVLGVHGLSKQVPLEGLLNAPAQAMPSSYGVLPFARNAMASAKRGAGKASSVLADAAHLGLLTTSDAVSALARKATLRNLMYLTLGTGALYSGYLANNAYKDIKDSTQKVRDFFGGNSEMLSTMHTSSNPKTRKISKAVSLLNDVKNKVIDPTTGMPTRGAHKANFLLSKLKKYVHN